ncbi:MAG: HindIII family type II restriction endonuclease [Caldilineales bacterium]|nr:HindIII family type II restriction endonuclease [Caldilineales bacterium]
MPGLLSAQDESFTHLAVLVRYAEYAGQAAAIGLVREVFNSVAAMNPSKNAATYWQAVNRTFVNADGSIRDLWREEKIASVESIELAREEALRFLAAERERIMRLTRDEAIREVLQWRKIENRIIAVQSVTDNNLLAAG